jgi:hypothetical protein
MKRIGLSMLFLLVAALLGYGPVAVFAQQMPAVKGVKPGVIQAIALDEQGSYCHLHFPAIDPQTLGGTPSLQAADSGDVIDFYGPCDHDPLGADEVTRQMMQQESDRGFNQGGSDGGGD